MRLCSSTSFFSKVKAGIGSVFGDKEPEPKKEEKPDMVISGPVSVQHLGSVSFGAEGIVVRTEVCASDEHYHTGCLSSHSSLTRQKATAFHLKFATLLMALMIASKPLVLNS
jgi:hypothetical protein